MNKIGYRIEPCPDGTACTDCKRALSKAWIVEESNGVVRKLCNDCFAERAEKAQEQSES